MSRGLLDTSVVIARMDGDLEAALPDELAISVATLAELHYGVLAAKDAEIRRYRLRRLGQIERLFHPIPIDAEIARAFATVADAVKSAGAQPRARVMDLWIAATALTHRIPLYTCNFTDFKILQRLIEIREV